MRFTRKWCTARRSEEYPSLGPGHPSRVRGASLPSARGERPPEKDTRRRELVDASLGKEAPVHRTMGLSFIGKKLTSVAKEGHATSETGSPCLGKGVLVPAKRLSDTRERAKRASEKKGCPTRVNGLSLPRVRAQPSHAKCVPVPRNIGGQSRGMRNPSLGNGLPVPQVRGPPVPRNGATPMGK